MQQGRCVVEDLIQRQQAEVHGHDLDYRTHAAQGRADAGADEAGFGQRGVADALGAELLQQAHAHREAATVAADVLAHEEHPLVAGHRLANRLPHRLAIRHLLDVNGGHEGSPGSL